MAIRHEATIRTHRPPADVFDTLVAVETWPTWLIASGITAVERLDPGDLAAGSRLRIQQFVAGRRATIDATVEAIERPTHFSVTGRDQDGAGTRIEARIGPDADPALTALGWQLEITLPFRLRIFEGLAAPQVRRAVDLDLEALRRRLESAPAD